MNNKIFQSFEIVNFHNYVKQFWEKSICIKMLINTCSLIDKSNILLTWRILFNISGEYQKRHSKIRTSKIFSWTILKSSFTISNSVGFFSNSNSVGYFYLFMRKALMYALKYTLFKSNIASVIQNIFSFAKSQAILTLVHILMLLCSLG